MQFCLIISLDLNTGGFGKVRACKFRKKDLRYRSPVSASTAASSDEEDGRSIQAATAKAVPAEESKFARLKTTIKPKKKTS